MLTRRRSKGPLIALLAMVISGAVWFAYPTETRTLLGRYSRSVCLSPHLDGQSTRSWDNSVRLPNPGSFKVTGKAWIGGEFEVAFADDGIARSITKYYDYIYPSDARFESKTNTLWLVVNGSGGGVFREARLYQYDVSSRTLARELDIDPDDLPAPCAPIGRTAQAEPPAPSRTSL